MKVFIVYMHIEYDEYDSDTDVEVFDSMEKALAFFQADDKRDHPWQKTIYEREMK